MNIKYWEKKIVELRKERWDKCFNHKIVGHPVLTNSDYEAYLSGYITAIKVILAMEKGEAVKK